MPTSSVDAPHDSDAPEALTPETVIVPGSVGGDVSAAAAGPASSTGHTTVPSSTVTATITVRILPRGDRIAPFCRIGATVEGRTSLTATPSVGLGRLEARSILRRQ